MSTRSFSARRARRSSVGATTTEETIYDHPGCATPLPPIIYRFLSCPLLSYIGRLRCIFQTTQCSKPLSPPSRAQPRNDEPNSKHEDAGECWMCRVLRRTCLDVFLGRTARRKMKAFGSQQLPRAPVLARSALERWRSVTSTSWEPLKKIGTPRFCRRSTEDDV